MLIQILKERLSKTFTLWYKNDNFLTNLILFLFRFLALFFIPIDFVLFTFNHLLMVTVSSLKSKSYNFDNVYQFCSSIEKEQISFWILFLLMLLFPIFILVFILSLYFEIILSIVNKLLGKKRLLIAYGFSIIIFIVSLFYFFYNSGTTKKMGISFGIIDNPVEEMIGYQVSIVSNSNQFSKKNNHSDSTMNYVSSPIDRVLGVQLSLLNNDVIKIMGFQYTIGINEAEKMLGVQCSIFSNESVDMVGIQLAGILNKSKEKIKGLTASAINLADKSITGVQFGLINYANKLNGIQIGLINITEKNWFPFINFDFHDDEEDKQNPVPNKPKEKLDGSLYRKYEIIPIFKSIPDIIIIYRNLIKCL